jgi:hypothetical protein
MYVEVKPDHSSSLYTNITFHWKRDTNFNTILCPSFTYNALIREIITICIVYFAMSSIIDSEIEDIIFPSKWWVFESVVTEIFKKYPLIFGR